MPRPAPHRLVSANYPVIETIQTRFQDLDPNRHLNNVAYAALFESARVKFERVFAGPGQFGLPFRAVVARNEINYIAEGSYPADVHIAVGIGAIGRRSWEILQLMEQDGVVIATCDSTIVMRATSGDALPDTFRAQIEALRVREE